MGAQLSNADRSVPVFTQSDAESLEDLRRRFAESKTVEADCLTRLLQSIWQQAAFVGAPSVARLARTLAPPPADETPQRRVEEKLDILEEGLQTLEALLREPHEPSLLARVDQCCDKLEELGHPVHPGWPLTAAEDPAERRPTQGAPPAGTETEGNQAAEHTDIDIYANDALDGLERCSQEETWLVSQLAAAAEDLAAGHAQHGSAHYLMRILSRHHFFQAVDRICMVGLVPGTNQLVVVDSCISDRLRAHGVRNRMPRGYSCFVNPRGSLSTMKPGTLRMFSDSHAVLASFARQAKPVQRSIAHVSESGLRSGICLAIGRAENTQGYLFMNSLVPELFRDIKRDYGPLLSLFSLLGTVSLDGAGFGRSVLSEEPESEKDPEKDVPQHGIAFEPQSCQHYLRTLLQRLTPAVPAVEVHAPAWLAFLYAPAFTLRLLAQLATEIGLVAANAEAAWRITVEKSGTWINFHLHANNPAWQTAPEDWRGARLNAFASRYAHVPMQFQLAPHGVTASVPYEPAIGNSTDVLYSVVH